jgi:hypothetical protein
MTTFLLMLTTALPATGDQSQPKPNTLTPKEAADGWLLLFDGETTFGWNGPLLAANPNRYGPLDKGIKGGTGVLHLGGDKEVRVWASPAFGDFRLDFEYRQEGQPGAVFRVHFQPSAVPSGGHGFFPAEANGWHRCTMTARGDRANGTYTISRQHYAPGGARLRDSSTISKSGYTVKLGFSVKAGTKLRLRNLKLQPLGLKAIFNGKDLTGWKEIPGRKSKFSVTKEGWLNVKDGPGDLQTEATWGDFVLQLDCIANGKHLNSGVFFRSVPGQFWSGYEAQIRNQWQGNDRSKPVDFGTGGLYGRQPARKVVSSDKEWFTLTVLAHGKHVAIWVNGYQTVDFTDDRKGARTDPGPISLQGHDPTTDLSFRNIRVADLKAK